jgi:hypothetical protein
MPPSSSQKLALLPPADPLPLPVFGGFTPTPSVPPPGWVGAGACVFTGAWVAGTAVLVAAAVAVLVGVCVLGSAIGPDRGSRFKFARHLPSESGNLANKSVATRCHVDTTTKLEC